MKWLRQHRGVFVTLLFVVSAAVIVALPFYPSSRWMPSRRSIDEKKLESVVRGVRYSLNEHNGKIPTTWAFTIYDGGLVSELLFSNERHVPIHSQAPLLGEITADDIYSFAWQDDPQPLVDAAQQLGVSGAWEHLGDVMISREVDAIESRNPSIVVCYFVHPRMGAVDGATFSSIFAFADGHSEIIRIITNGTTDQQYLDMLAADRAARTELGLSEPPDYVALIREYTEAQRED